MKKSLLLCVSVTLLISGVSWGQNRDNEPDKIAFLAGWTYSKYKLGEAGPKESGFKSGFMIGINTENSFLPFLWSSLGLGYYQIGAKTDEGTYEFHYLMVPAGFKLKIGPVFGTAGLYAAYSLTGHLDEMKLDLQKYNRFDFGSYLGGGIKFLMVTIDLKYHQGFSDITNGKSIESPNYDLRNRFFSLTLGIGIP